MDKPRVFVASSTAALRLAEAVKTNLSEEAEVILWNDQGVFGLSIGTLEALLSKLDELDFAILLFTPDDSFTQGNQEITKPRDNVVLEFGLFAGALGRDRTFVIKPNVDSLRIPTDLAGVTVASLPGYDPNQKAPDLGMACGRIRAEIQKKGHRPRLSAELAVLYRFINALTGPHYKSIFFEALKRARIRYRREGEIFEQVDQVLDFLGDVLADYIYPQLSPQQLQNLRVYFAYYLGDGIAGKPVTNPITTCSDIDDFGAEFAGEFVIGLANPRIGTADTNWRVGRPIRGFDGGVPQSMCANVFHKGEMDGFSDSKKLSQGVPNYKVRDERSTFSFPVEWRSHDGNGRVGVITVSSRIPDLIGDEIQTIIQLLTNIVGFLFSAYAVGSRGTLEREGALWREKNSNKCGFSQLSESDESKRFVLATIGLRREIASYFENNFKASKIHLEQSNGIKYCLPHAEKAAAH